MKHRKLLIGVLLTSVLLLPACKGGTMPTEPEKAISGTTLPEQTQISVEPDLEVQPTAEIELVPTQFTPFEQSYFANPVSDRDYSQYNVVTLLPPDGIPALTNPSYYGVGGADKEYEPEELVIGIEFNGDARAYSIGLLSSHEIVNDTVGGIHLAVTW